MTELIKKLILFELELINKMQNQILERLKVYETNDVYFIRHFIEESQVRNKFAIDEAKSIKTETDSNLP